MTSMIDGKKTYAGLVLVLLPMVARWMGVELTDEETQATGELVMQVAGWLLASIGAIHKDKKIAAERARRYPMTSIVAASLLGLGLGGSGIESARAQDVLIDHVKATTLELDSSAGAKITGYKPGWPQGNGVLHPAHGATVYDQYRWVSKGGADADSGLSPFQPKLTIKAAVESLIATGFASRGTGTIWVGPGVYEEEPIGVTTQALGQGIRIIGSGSAPVNGTEIRPKASAFTSSSDLLTFHATQNIHHAEIRNLRIDMRGIGRDAIRMGRGGFNAVIDNVLIENAPRWAIYHFYRPVSLWVFNLGAANCGWGQGTGWESVTFADTGGGNYHLSNISDYWSAGTTVRISAQTTMPGGLAHHTDYYLVDDGGELHLSATLGGPPLAATSAGTGSIVLYGGDKIPDIGQVTFTDTGGGNYHLVNPLPRDWVAGDAVRIRSTAIIPAGLSGGTTYYLVDDGGLLHLSATPGGAPLAATSAGTGIIRLEDDYDPETEGGVFYLNNSALTSSSSIAFNGVQVDSGGRYPFFIDEQTNTTVGVFSLVNLETEDPYYSQVFDHDAIVGVRGNAGDAKTMIVADSWTLHANGTVNAGRAAVKQLNAGANTVILSSRNITSAGAYDFLFESGGGEVKADFQDVPWTSYGGPVVAHGYDANAVLFEGGHGVHPTNKGPATPTVRIVGSGALQLGTGSAAPTTRISVNSSNELTLDVASLPTADPGRSGAIWRDVAGGNVLKISP